MNPHTFHLNSPVQLLIDPADQASANSSWVAPFASGYRAERAVFIMPVGTIAAEEIDLKITQATDSSGTGAKDITGAAITQITTAGGNEVVSIEIGPGALDDANGFKYVRAEVTVDNAGAEPYAVLLVKHRLRHAVSDAIDSTYSQYVVVE